MSIIYLTNQRPQYDRFSHTKIILGRIMKIGMRTVIKQSVVMIIGDIKMIGTITDKMVVMIKDKTLITGIFLRKGTTTSDNHITVIVIKENIISTEVSISVTINQKVHDNFNTTIVKEVVKMCRIRLCQRRG